LTNFLPPEVRGELFRRSALAATFAALGVRDGRIGLRQERAFGPIYLRSPAALAGGAGGERPGAVLAPRRALLFASAERSTGDPRPASRSGR
jgi:hypothetical protein